MAKVIINDYNLDFVDLFADAQAYDDEDDGEIEKQITGILFGTDDEGNEYIQFKVEFDSSSTSYLRYIFRSGGIEKYASSNGSTNWTKITTFHATSARFGSVELSDSYTATGSAAAGLAPSQKALKDGLATRAAVNHASSATTYGIGTASYYGHVKLSNNYAATGAAASGLAPSQKALSDGLATKAASTINDVSTPSVTWATEGGVHSSNNSVRRSGNIVEVSTVLITSPSASGNVITGLPAPANGGFYMIFTPYDGSTPFAFQLTSAGVLKRSGTNATSNKEVDIHFTYITNA